MASRGEEAAPAGARPTLITTSSAPDNDERSDLTRDLGREWPLARLLQDAELGGGRGPGGAWAKSPGGASASPPLGYVREQRVRGPLEAAVTAHIQDTVLPRCASPGLGGLCVRENFLFVGHAGTGSGLHWDLTTNAVTVLAGLKHVLLLPPGSREHLQAVPECWPLARPYGRSSLVGLADERSYCHGCEQCQALYIRHGGHDGAGLHCWTPSERGALCPAPAGTPATCRSIVAHRWFAGVPGVACALIRAGETLVIPRGWIHAVHNLSPVVSISSQLRTQHPF